MPRAPLLPAPSVAAHGLEVAVSLPAELLPGAAGVGIVGGHVAGATRRDGEGHLGAGGALERTHQLEHAAAAARAEVEYAERLEALHGVERGDVPAYEIGDMDIVAYPGAVRRRVIVSEDGELGQLSRGDAGHVRHQVAGDAPWIVPEQAAFVGADGV